MERDSILYKLRRKLQVLAYHILPNEFLSKIYFKIVLKKELNFSEPKTFNEKIQWMKLYYFPKNQLVVNGADKYAVREYVESKGLGSILVPLLGVWSNAKRIEWDKLPKQFVLKCNHGCAYNILCADKQSFNTKAAENQLNEWLKEDFGVFNIEIHYSEITKRLITCEEYLGDCITDYKFFCFNGEPKYIYVSTDLVHDRQAQMAFYYMDGKKMPMIRDDYAPLDIEQFPPFFEEMKNAAKILCKDFPFVRVDFFVANNKFYFAELTFTPGAGMMPFNPDKFDLEWGNLLDISNLK